MEHKDLVKALSKPGKQILSELSEKDVELLHMAIGVAEEGGEILGNVKKYIFYRKLLDIGKVIEELGDIEYFLEGLRQQLGLSREQCIKNNITKLSKRYKGLKYSNEAAINRVDQHE